METDLLAVWTVAHRRNPPVALRACSDRLAAERAEATLAAVHGLCDQTGQNRPEGAVIARVVELSGYNTYYNPTLKESTMSSLKLTGIGNSVGVVLPKDLLARLRVKRGDRLYAIETPNGIELTPYDPAFAAQMDAAEEIMREDRDVLKKLAE